MSQRANKVDLRKIFMGLQEQMISKLSTNKEIISHPTTKGDASELGWIDMLNTYLPGRYQVDKAFVLDSEGSVSEQIDVVIYDRQYSPFLFNQDNAVYIPAESVYAVFEVRQNLNKEVLKYAAQKAKSVRVLKRTSTRIPHAGGEFKPKKPSEILAGVLTLGSDWNPPLGSAFTSACSELSELEQIDVGCCLRCGGFEVRYGAVVKIEKSGRDDSLIFFFVGLLERLQKLGTVTAIDISQYYSSALDK